MNQIEKAVLTKVFGVLDSIGVQYAIVDSDGNKHGALNVAQEKKAKRRRSIYPLGEVKGYIMPFMQGMMINTTKQIPVGPYDAKVIRGSVSSYATQMWGGGNYKSSVTSDKKFVEITRLDPQVAAFMKNNPVDDLLSGLDDLPTPKPTATNGGVAFDINRLRIPRNI